MRRQVPGALAAERRRSGGRLWTLLLLALITSTSAVAGGEWETSKEEIAAKKTDGRWEAEGKKAIPEMLNRLCAEETGWLSSYARERLTELGPSAAKALFAKAECDAAARVLAPIACDADPSLKLVMDGLYGDARKAKAAALNTFRFANCVAEARVAQVVGPGLRKVLQKRGQDREVLRVLFLMGKEAARLWPSVTPLLENKELVEETGLAFARMGPGAKGAAPALRKAMQTFPEHRGVLIRAWSVVAPEDPEGVAFSRQLLAEKLEAPCEESEVSALLAVVARFGVRARAETAQLLIDASRKFAVCRRGGNAQWPEAFVELGGAEGVAALRGILRNDLASSVARVEAAKGLEKLNAKQPQDAPLVTALWEKVRPAQPQVIQVPRKRSPEQSALEAWNVCRRESKLSGDVAIKPVGESEQLESLATCFGDLLCGEGAERYARAVSHCCASAFASGPPGWCAP